MGEFDKRFQGRNHVAGQLVTSDELLEMQSMIRRTICGIQADQYGLNPDGTFTPHVISGLTPRVDTLSRSVIIGRGHGWVTKSLIPLDFERYPIIVEDDISIVIPDGDATHPKWCHVYLWNPVASFDTTDGSVAVATKDVNFIVKNVVTPIYTHMVTSEAAILDGTPNAAPECPIMGIPSWLPIATVYIPAADSGLLSAANLYDVRWFAPGGGSAHGKFTWTFVGTTLFAKWGTNFESLLFKDTLKVDDGTTPTVEFSYPSTFVFPLIPEILTRESFILLTGTAAAAINYVSGGSDATVPKVNAEVVITATAAANWALSYSVQLFKAQNEN